MPGSLATCERAQLALIEGRDADWVPDHVAACDECRFFKGLSSQLAGSASVTATSQETGALGAGFEALLSQAQATRAPLDRYRVLGSLGRGGQGVVLRALDTETGETLALKLVRARSGRADGAAEVFHAHLVRHPGVCRVYHTERHGEVRLIAMELIEGRRLDQAAEELPPAGRLALLRAVCDAVDAAHRAGVLHLDLKPANVLVRDTGEPVVTDFGLSTRLAGDSDSGRHGGTPGYMAPEQAAGRPVDRRTDVYALGRLVGELLPRPPRGLSRVIRKATDPDPTRRHPDAAGLARDLERWQGSRRRLWRGAGAAGAAVLLAGTLLSTGSRPPARDVLVVGGVSADGRWSASAEVFDATSSRWTPIDPVPDPGQSASRTCMARAVRAGGEVLFIGGGSATGCADDGATTSRVRFFDSGRAIWSAPDCQEACAEQDGTSWRFDAREADVVRRWKTGPCAARGPCLQFARSNFVALALPSGDVMVYGGCAGGCSGPNELDQTLRRPAALARSAERFDRRRRLWEPLPPSLLPRTGSAAALLPGSVLVCGGSDGTGQARPADRPLPEDTCEQFDLNSPATGARPWREAGRMPEPLAPALARTLRFGVLGVQSAHAWIWRESAAPAWDASSFAQVPTPAGGQWSGTLTPLADGRALLAGGRSGSSSVARAQAFVFDAAGAGGRWADLPPMREARYGHAAVPLPDGRVLVVGGCAQDGPLATAELFDPRTDRWHPAGTMTSPRCHPEAVALR